MLYLECSSHPEGVAGVDRLVGAPVEARLLPHDAPASDPIQLPSAQRLLQSAHQTQGGDSAVRPAACTTDTRAGVGVLDEGTSWRSDEAFPTMVSNTFFMFYLFEYLSGREQEETWKLFVPFQQV